MTTEKPVEEPVEDWIEQQVLADPDEEPTVAPEIAPGTAANEADLLEQHEIVTEPEDDYPEMRTDTRYPTPDER
jgi:hypothetical protein